MHLRVFGLGNAAGALGAALFVFASLGMGLLISAIVSSMPRRRFLRAAGIGGAAMAAAASSPLGSFRMRKVSR